MTSTSTAFTAERAPCGRVGDGRRHQESDDEGFRIDDWNYACGCRGIRHSSTTGQCGARRSATTARCCSDEHSGDHEA